MNDQEFFIVHHALTINVEPLGPEVPLPTVERFEAEIPAPFIVASEFSHLDSLTEQAKSELKNNSFSHVCQLLDTQNAKLNLLLTFMLSQQDNEGLRYKTTTFGASQFSYLADEALPVHSRVRAKLFLEYPAAAIYCYGVITHCEEDEQGYKITVRYELLREIDQDLLIKSALHQQQKLLRQRSLDRNK